MMVETPAKRLRILQSVEVDETHPDYIEAKQKQQQKFKSRLERIFDKYESMHESMSDEIDFKTGKVVVDRGHIRRVQRQLTRKGPTLVDNFLGSAPEEDDGPGDDEGQAGSEDELAPTQTRKRKRDSVEGSIERAPSSEQRNTTSDATPQAMQKELAQHRASQIPNTPNPAANLLEGIHFPQTPLGQQAQAAFVANLNQTIVQAVQQVVAPLFGILQGTPNVQAPPAHFPIPTLQPAPTDAVRPAADPKWYFPPISAVNEVSQNGQPRSSPPLSNTAPRSTTHNNDISSPLVPRRRSPKVYIQNRPSALKRRRTPQIVEASFDGLQDSHPLPARGNDPGDCPASKPIIETVSGRKPSNPKGRRTYHFTEEDDAYISERRRLHNTTFTDIQRSRAKWLGWPASAFMNRWNNHLKNGNPHEGTGSKLRVPERNCLPTSEEQEEQFFSSIEIPETSSAEHRLPTPSSLEHGKDSIERTVIRSSSHFDDDELELLSLAGADISDVQPRHSFEGEDDAYPAPDEPLPSIEGAEFRDEGELQDELQRELLKMEDSPTPGPHQTKTLPSTIPETQESVVVVSPLRQKCETIGKPKPKPLSRYRACSDSSDDLDLIGADDKPSTPYIQIKRESLTPQATRILCSSPALKTPRPRPQSSSMAGSTGKLNRRAFLNDVKKGWAKGNGKALSSQKRRSLNIYVRMSDRKQVDSEAGLSEDELAG